MVRPAVLTNRSPAIDDVGILLVRVMMGVIFVNASLGDFETGFAELAELHGGAGIPLPELSAPYTALVQLIGGALLIAGVLTRLWAAGLIVVMLGAVFFVHLEEGFGEIAYPLLLAAALAALIGTGPGRYSVDHLVVERRE